MKSLIMLSYFSTKAPKRLLLEKQKRVFGVLKPKICRAPSPDRNIFLGRWFLAPTLRAIVSDHRAVVCDICGATCRGACVCMTRETIGWEIL